MKASEQLTKRIAILGGGPSGLFIFKRLLETEPAYFEVTIFEATDRLGEGFPYSPDGANNEHVTNVSANEIPELVTTVSEWVKMLPVETLKKFDINPHNFNDFKVLPRLLFGKYLAAQFDLLTKRAKNKGLTTFIRFNSKVTDITDHPDFNFIAVEVNDTDILEFDIVILCTGHNWPVIHETIVPGYFDSPYPPKKLLKQFNHPVAIRGASLTAIDAIRTLARQHGNFIRKENKKIVYLPHEHSANFRVIVHSLNGMLPAIRFHLEDSHLSKNALLSNEEIASHIKENGGFLSLDFIFERNFKEAFREKDRVFFERIRNMNMEEFVDEMMSFRESIDAFDLFKGEYAEAATSIRRKESVYWKEMLAILSFTMNYPAKHLSAEDMQRLQLVLMPLISIVIAFVPQSSCEELIALHDARILTLVDVGAESKVVANAEGGITYHHENTKGSVLKTKYQTFIDCVGQPHLSLNAFPFKSVLKSGAVSAARLKFRSADEAKTLLASGNTNIETSGENEYFLTVPGVAINDHFQAIDKWGAVSGRLYIMAVPYIGGYNPDYSGLDFCEEASKIIVKRITE